MLQPLPQLLLPFRSQPAECWIILQLPLLFRWRQILIVPQPVPGMPPLRRTRLLRLPRRLLSLSRGRCCDPSCLRCVKSRDSVRQTW